MDDDDYYPPCRVSHAVETLQANPEALVVGSRNCIFIFMKLIKYINLAHMDQSIQQGHLLFADNI